MARGLNKVQLIGNLTHDPELRYTAQGTAVCSFSLAVNRSYTQDGEKKDEVEFVKVVTWTKLAENVGQYLKKGAKAYVEGRLQTRDWKTKEGQDRQTTEVVANEVIFLDSMTGSTGSSDYDISEEDVEGSSASDTKNNVKSSKKPAEEKNSTDEDEDIPF